MTGRRDASDRDTDAFVRRVAGAYAPPAPTAAARARFDARLDARLARARRQPWLAAAVAAAALSLSLHVWRASEVTPGRDAGPVAAASAEAILAMADDAGDASDALPTDYQAISDLLLGD